MVHIANVSRCNILHFQAKPQKYQTLVPANLRYYDVSRHVQKHKAVTVTDFSKCQFAATEVICACADINGVTTSVAAHRLFKKVVIVTAVL